MSQIKGPLDIYKLLEKSNCGLCLRPSCMAFAVSVINGEKRLDNCPRLDRKVIEQLEGGIVKREALEPDQQELLEELKRKIAPLDFFTATERVDASVVGEKLSVMCLGKEFQIDNKGNMYSECHVNTWVQIPLLNYIISSKGEDVSGEWVPFGKFQGAMHWGAFFARRCEEPLKKIADTHTDLFFDTLSMFDGRPVTKGLSADRAIVLYPLPKVPFLICYWKTEDDFESKLSVLFDKTAGSNLNIESIYLIGAGFVEMLKLIIHKHS